MTVQGYWVLNWRQKQRFVTNSSLGSKEKTLGEVSTWSIGAFNRFLRTKVRTQRSWQIPKADTVTMMLLTSRTTLLTSKTLWLWLNLAKSSKCEPWCKPLNIELCAFLQLLSAHQGTPYNMFKPQRAAETLVAPSKLSIDSHSGFLRMGTQSKYWELIERAESVR